MMSTRPDDTGAPDQAPATENRRAEAAQGARAGRSDDEQHRRVRRRQMIAAILAIVAIIIFALIQGFLGAPSKIPGTH
jgi:vancomycin permeability regulator SanA